MWPIERHRQGDFCYLKPLYLPYLWKYSTY